MSLLKFQANRHVLYLLMCMGEFCESVEYVLDDLCSLVNLVNLTDGVYFGENNEV